MQELTSLNDDGTAGPGGRFIAPQLQVIVDALTAMPRANSGLTWIRQKHVDHVLRELASHPTLTHDVIDQLPPGRTTNYFDLKNPGVVER